MLSFLPHYPVNWVETGPGQYAIAATGDLQVFATARDHAQGLEAPAHVWRMGQPGARFAVEKRGPISVVVNPEGRYLAIVGGTQLLVTDADGKKVAEWTSEANSIQFPVFSPDGHRLTFQVDSQIHTFDLVNGGHTQEPVAPLVPLPASGPPKFPIWSSASMHAYSRDGTVLAEAINGMRGDYRVVIKNRQNGEIRTEIAMPFIHGLTLSSRGDFLATAHSEYVVLWDGRSGQRLGRYAIGAAHQRHVHLSDDGKFLLVGSYDEAMLYRLR